MCTSGVCVLKMRVTNFSVSIFILPSADVSANVDRMLATIGFKYSVNMPGYALKNKYFKYLIIFLCKIPPYQIRKQIINSKTGHNTFPADFLLQIFNQHCGLFLQFGENFTPIWIQFIRQNLFKACGRKKFRGTKIVQTMNILDKIILLI